MSRPDDIQRLLLRAATGEGEGALEAWREWEMRTEIEHLEPDSQWLLPALDQSLRRLGVPEADRSRPHGVYRHNWYKNHLALHRAARVIDAARRRGAVVILGGAAMAMAHYETIGERPFEAVELLSPDGTEGIGEPCLPLKRLHGPDLDEAMVGRTAPLRWRSLEAASLDPADQLLDVCARRREWDSRSGLLWMCDVAAVFRRHPALRWADAAERAEEAGLGESIREVRRELGELAPRGDG